jgi:hypothetical protein
VEETEKSTTDAKIPALASSSSGTIARHAQHQPSETAKRGVH